ncbi:hypothetical protein [Bacillus coahuilensis]|nr:hypothetical protein [Bacillus coahuilensis]
MTKGNNKNKGQHASVSPSGSQPDQVKTNSKSRLEKAAKKLNTK